VSRITATAIRSAISLVILGILAAIIALVWYPGLFFMADGGWQGLRLVVLVELVMGPVLTFVVFKSGKPGLRSDLVAIGLLQVAALCGGIYVVASERPIAVVFVDGGFFTVSRGDFEDAGIAVPDLSKFPGAYPKWLAVDIPDDPEAQSKIRGQMLAARTPLRLLVQRYVPFRWNSAVDNAASDLADIERRDRQHVELPRWLINHGATLSSYRFFPFASRYKYVFAGYRNGQLQGLLDLKVPYAPERSS
jgi:hypothetical protein